SSGKTRPIDRYGPQHNNKHSNSDNMSDSSSSQDAILNSPKRPEYSSPLVNGNRNRKLSSSSSSSSTRFREPPPEVMQRSQRYQPEPEPVFHEPELTEELVNDLGQWSCR